MDVSQVRADLIAEQESLDRLVGPLPDEAWATPTASPRWTIGDQIGHLAYFDATAALAIRDEAAFVAHRAELLTAFTSEEAVDEATLGAYRQMPPAERLGAWRAERQALADASATLADDQRVEWYGPSMGAKSFLTARLMECWAHGQDVADTVGVERQPTDRILHVARLGVITRGWTYKNRRLEMPDVPVGVVLDAPSGERWDLGDADAEQRIEGSANDFCLVVTQRRHIDDTALTVTGDAARDWMRKAQVFAGPATDGPAPRS